MIAFKDNQLMKMCESWKGGLPNLAMGYALGRNSGVMADIPTVAGFSRTSEVHEAVAVWREVANGASGGRRERENAIIETLGESGWENYSWRSPQ